MVLFSQKKVGQKGLTRSEYTPDIVLSCLFLAFPEAFPRG